MEANSVSAFQVCPYSFFKASTLVLGIQLEHTINMYEMYRLIYQMHQKRIENHRQPVEDKWKDCVTCPDETGLTGADFR